ncbi:hypothetical protein C3747_71g116 [Trypanosoma cruzi]|uniref:Peroxin 19 n=1 Tax=Trypanosoma cruzi TaxID=5693 RepID=A0A2V2WNM7_TRYCR|nr:hypothetical protein C3747_71g116 [Trypanosoma cruzi]RNC33122.1 peroxin 19 [Trypanosoma cruzi]
MKNPHDDDELDALLDDCINTMDEQERRHEEEVRARDAAREAELEKGTADSNQSGELMGLLQALMNGENGDGNADPETLMNTLNEEITRVSSLIDSLPDASEEERASMTEVREIFDRLTKMSSTNEDDAAGGNAMNSDETLAEAFKKYMADIEKTSGSSAGNAAASETPRNTSSTEAPTATANAAEFEDVIAGLSGMVLDCLLDPGMLRIMKVMQRTYPRWLAANESSTSVNDLARYKKQYDVVNSICDLVGDGPIDRQDETKTSQLVSLTHEFASLGPLPPDLEKLDAEEEQCE